jgi:hypothetical protein
MNPSFATNDKSSHLGGRTVFDTKLYRIGVVLALVAFAAPTAWAGPSFTFTPVGPAGVSNFMAEGINDAGDIAGIAQLPTGASTSYVSSGGVYSVVNVPGSQSGTTLVLNLNSNGQFVGGYTDTNGGVHGFFYDGTNYQTVNYTPTTVPPTPGLVTLSLAGINNHGMAVGTGTDIFGNTYSFTYANGVVTPITNPAGSLGAIGINDSGAIVGSFNNGASAFLLQGSNLTTFTAPNGIFTIAGDINDSGAIVGIYLDPNFVSHGFLYENGVFTSIDDPLASPLGEGTMVNGINNEGQIVGFYFDSNGITNSFVAQLVVPEPGSLTLLSVAGVAAAGWRLRRRS